LINRVFSFGARAAACLGILCALAVPTVASIGGGGSGGQIPRLPDLTITQVTPVFNRLTFQYVPDRLWVQITNQGTGGAGPFEMFTEWGQGYGNQQEFFFFTQGLAAGQSVWVQVDAQGYDVMDGNFLAWVDNTNAVVESDETNNVYEK